MSPNVETIINSWPVFVMGAERSGTSTLARFLHEEVGYKGQSEGHVFSLLKKLESQLESYFVDNGFKRSEHGEFRNANLFATTTAQLVSYGTFRSGLRALWRELAGLYNNGLWFDKTPGPDFIRCAPALAEMYSNAKFVFLIRDPVSAVESSMRKFGIPFEDACQRWKECAEAWLQAKGELTEGCYLEIKTHELSSKTAECLSRLAGLLSEHPLGFEPTELAQRNLVTVERTSLSDPGVVRPLEEAGWSEAQQHHFRMNCAALGRIYGFEEEAGKRATGRKQLPPPYGQKNVSISFGEMGGVWPELHQGEVCIFMHPSLSAPETSLTYAGIELGSSGKLEADVFVLPGQALPVTFEIIVTEESVPAVLCSAKRDCAAGAKERLVVDVPPHSKKLVIKLLTRSTGETVDQAWSLFSCPEFTPDPSRPR